MPSSQRVCLNATPGLVSYTVLQMARATAGEARHRCRVVTSVGVPL